MIEIDIKKYAQNLVVKKEIGMRYLKCVIRRKYLVITPEEMIRQLLLHFLIEKQGFNKNRIAVEKQLIVNELKKRCDILIFDKNMNPWMLVECKALEVAIDEKVFKQIAWYNMPLKVPFLMVTNGEQTFCCEMDYENQTYEFLQKVPEYQFEK